jgi:hypothetical protein
MDCSPCDGPPLSRRSFCDREPSLTGIVGEIVAIPGPLVTPKAAELRAQSLPRCKTPLASIAW